MSDGRSIWRESSLRPVLTGKRAARSILGAPPLERGPRLEEVVVALYVAGRRAEADALLARLDEAGNAGSFDLRALHAAALPGRSWRTNLNYRAELDEIDARRQMLMWRYRADAVAHEPIRCLRDVLDIAPAAYATADPSSYFEAVDAFLARWPDRAWDVGPLTLDLAALAGDHDRLAETITGLLTRRVGLPVTDLTCTEALCRALVAGAYAASPAVAPARTANLDELFAAVDECLDGGRPDLDAVLKTLGRRVRPGAPEREIAALEQRLGVALPVDYRALLARTDGVARRGSDSVVLLPAERVIRVAEAAAYREWADAVGDPYIGEELGDDLDGDLRRLPGALLIGSAGEDICVLVPPRDAAAAWECWRVWLLECDVTTYAGVHELLLDG